MLNSPRVPVEVWQCWNISLHCFTINHHLVQKEPSFFGFCTLKLVISFVFVTCNCICMGECFPAGGNILCDSRPWVPSHIQTFSESHLLPCICIYIENICICIYTWVLGPPISFIILPWYSSQQISGKQFNKTAQCQFQIHSSASLQYNQWQGRWAVCLAMTRTDRHGAYHLTNLMRKRWLEGGFFWR